MFKKNTPFLFIGILGLLIVVLLLYLFGVYYKNNLNESKVWKEASHSQNLFKILESTDVKALSSTLEAILQDPGFKEVYLRKDREELFEYGQPLFEKIRESYGITHFYFHLPDGTNFVRIHNKLKYGDEVNRATFRQARDSKSIGYGIELGETAFALRVVKPYYDNDKLIGYIELGQEIEHFLQILKEETGNDYSIFVEKNQLNKLSWESVRQVRGLANNWDEFVNIMQIDSTVKTKNECFSETNAEKVFSLDAKEGGITLGKIKDNMSCAGFSLIGVSGNKIGVTLMSYDVSSELQFVNSLVSQQIVFIIFLLIVVFGVSTYYSKKITFVENKYKNLFENSHDAIMTLTPPDWRFTDGNSATLQLFDLKDKQELKNITPGDVSPEHQPDGKLSSEKAKEMIGMAMKEGSNSFEWTHKKLKGPEFLASVTLVKMGDDKNAFLQAVVRDITEVKIAGESIRKSAEETKKALEETKKINKLMVGRELEMIKLKKEIQELKTKNHD